MRLGGAVCVYAVCMESGQSLHAWVAGSGSRGASAPSPPNEAQVLRRQLGPEEIKPLWAQPDPNPNVSWAS